MSGLPRLDDCSFYTEPAKDSRFVGRVREFPDLKSTPQAKSIDALDQVITKTRDKLAELSAATDPHGFGAQPRERAGG